MIFYGYKTSNVEKKGLLNIIIVYLCERENVTFLRIVFLDL